MNEIDPGARPLAPAQLELLAAYVDGVLDADERRRAEELLETSEAAREVLATAVQISEAEGAGATDDLAQAPPGSATARARLRWWQVAVPLVAAAALALVFLGRPDQRRAPELARSLAAGASGAGLAPFAGWDVLRGANDGAPLARISARWLGVLTSLQAGDEGTARTELARMLAELAGRTGTEVLRSRLEALAAPGSVLDAEALRASDAALRDLDPVAYDAGTLLAGLRVAAGTGQAAAVSGLADGLVAHRAWLVALLDAPAVDRVLTSARPTDGGAPALDAVRAATEALLGRLGA